MITNLNNGCNYAKKNISSGNNNKNDNNKKSNNKNNYNNNNKKKMVMHSVVLRLEFARSPHAS